jgi:hypothetical protein
VSVFALLTAGLKCVQSEAFGIEIDLIRQGKPLKGSPIANLNPFLDEHGILRVGGRIINIEHISGHTLRPLDNIRHLY